MSFRARERKKETDRERNHAFLENRMGCEHAVRNTIIVRPQPHTISLSKPLAQCSASSANRTPPSSRGPGIQSHSRKMKFIFNSRADVNSHRSITQRPVASYATANVIATLAARSRPTVASSVPDHLTCNCGSLSPILISRFSCTCKYAVSGSLDALSDALAERREKFLLACDESRVPALIDCRRERVPASPRRCRALLARTESLFSRAIEET